MKKLRIFFSVILSLSILFCMTGISGQESMTTTDLISASDSISITNISDAIVHAATGNIYESEEGFYESVGNLAMQDDPDLIYYIKTNYQTGKRYIYSNKDSFEVVQSIQPERIHVEPEDIQASDIPELAVPMSYTAISGTRQAQPPYSRVCQLYVTYQSSDKTLTAEGLGTGFFVGPYQIATSAHALQTVDPATQKILYATSVTVYYSFIDPNSNTAKFGVAGASGSDICSSYNPLQSSLRSDYAIIDTYADLGNICSYVKLNPEDIDTSKNYRTFGFPGPSYGATVKSSSSTTPNEMRYSVGSVSNVNDGYFNFDFDFFRGMSGSPILFIKDGLYQAVGIGKGEYGTNNYVATRISWDAYTFFNKNVGFKNNSLYQISGATKLEGVKAFQQYINNNLPMQYLGTKLTVDGGFGPATKTAAIKMLQYWLNTTYGAGLAIDGGFGPATTNAIQSVIYGQTGMGVYILQGLLYGNGYDPKGFDGSFGANGGQGCLNAVKYFQSDNNLQVDGRAGPATLYALCS